MKSSENFPSSDTLSSEKLFMILVISIILEDNLSWMPSKVVRLEDIFMEDNQLKSWR